MSEITTLESRIVRVEIHRRKALITRAARLNLPAGSAAPYRLEGLPVILEDDSVRVAGLARGGGRLLDLRVELDLASAGGMLRGPGEEALRDLLRERVELEVQLARLTWEQEQLRELEPGRFSVADLPEPLAFSARPTAKAWLKMIPTVTRRLSGLQEAVRELGLELEQLDDRIQAARDELRREGDAAGRRAARAHKAILLRLEPAGDRARLLELELSYLVPAARWLPEYELRVDRVEDSAELVLRASLAQRTGEEWEEVALSCSSADLARSAALPRLDSWRIGRKQERPATGWRELPDNTGELFEDYDRGAAAAPAPATLRDLPAVPGEARFLGQDPEALMEALLEAYVPVSKPEPARYAYGAAPEPLPPPQQAPPPPAAPPPMPEMPMAMALESAGAYESNAYDEDDDFRDTEETLARAILDEPSTDMLMSQAPAPAEYKKKAKRARRSAPARPQAAMEHSLAVAGASSRSLLEGGEDAGNFAPAFEPEPALPDAGEDALAFHRLELAGPEDLGGRGKLKARSLRDEVAAQDAELGRLPEYELRSQLAGPSAGRVELPVPEYGEPLESSAGHFSVRYRSEGPASVASDGAPHRVGLLRREGPVRRTYRCVPAQDQNVYEQCTFVNPLGLPLLAGPIRVYRGGDYLVSGPLATTPRGGEVTVGLGVEPGLVVARNCRFEERSQGIFGGDTVLEHTITLEVRSRLPRAVRLELLERVPVTSEKDVEVEVMVTIPEAIPYDQRDRGRLVRGGLRFVLDLAPGEEKTCTLKYQVTIPSKMAIQGGNRRD